MRTVTISKANRLGNRLAKGGEPSQEDRQLLEQVRSDHDASMAEVQTALVGLGLQSTSRLKTTGTIIDKLRRDRTRLSKMQDIAGVRIVQDMRLDQQDDMVGRIMGSFSGAEWEDRRSRPSHGYRAVHVITEVESCKVEIQVRTKLQDQWAQMMEALEGELGRGIRYGEKPSSPRNRYPAIGAGLGHRRPTQTQVMRAMKGLAGLIEAVELGRASEAAGHPSTTTKKFKRTLARTEKEVRSTCEDLLETFEFIRKGGIE